MGMDLHGRAHILETQDGIHQKTVPPPFEPWTPTILQTDASGLAMTSTSNQYDGFAILRPVNIYSHKCSSVKQNSDVYDWELLAIAEELSQ